MKVVINETPSPKRESSYPVLKQYIDIDSGAKTLVYFTEPDAGLVIDSNNKYHLKSIGKFASGWSERSFVEFPGSVTLSNN